MGGYDFMQIALDLYKDYLANPQGEKSAPPITTMTGSTPARVVMELNKVRVLCYESKTPALYREPVLMVPSIINRAYIMDLLPGFSLAEHLISKGFSTYLVDWGTPTDEDHLITFDDLTDTMLDRVVRAVARDAGVDKVSLIGYCMGATMSIIYTALHPERVANLVNLLGPVDFCKAGMLGDWTNPKSFNADLMIDAYGNVPPALMQSSFQSMRPTQTLAKTLKPAPTDLDPELARFFTALEYWAWDNIPFPGEAYKKYIRELYQENRLMNGTLRIHGRLVDLKQVNCPVLVLTADRDHIVPADSANSLTNQVGSRKVETTIVKGGHVAAVVGPTGRQQLWPALSHWLGEQSSKL